MGTLPQTNHWFDAKRILKREMLAGFLLVMDHANDGPILCERSTVAWEKIKGVDPVEKKPP